MAERIWGDTVRHRLNSGYSGYLLIACLAAGILLFSGCFAGYPPEAQKLVGSWQMMTDQEVRSSDLNDDSLANRMARDSNRVDQAVRSDNLIRIQFQPNGVLKTFALQEKRGTWSFKSASNGGNQINILCKLGDEEVDTRIEFHSNDTISMVPPNIAVLEKELMFKRVGD